MSHRSSFFRCPFLRLRLFSFLLILLQLVSPLSLVPLTVLASNTPSSSQVKANRTVPKVDPPSADLHFSVTPTDSELVHARLLSEPLLPQGPTTPAENRELGAALLAFHHSRTKAGLSGLEQFIAVHPQSPWRASLLADLGLYYRQHGYHSKALDAWNEAWILTKDQTDASTQVLADRVVAELLTLLASLGRSEEIRPLLDQIQNRSFHGAALSKIMVARQSLWLMDNKPEISFKCGPYALDRIRTFQNPVSAHDPLIVNAASPSKGFSLDQVKKLSDQLHMGYQIAQRSPGAIILTPAVIHWKLGHYAAILKQTATGEYLVQDPTFGQETFLTADAINSEASGYFLVPKGKLPPGWKSVSNQEASVIYGRGLVSQSVPTATTQGDVKCPNCPHPPGMATWTVLAMLLSPQLEDTPVGYNPPLGPGIPFTVTFNQLEASQPATFTYSNLGSLWVHNWMAYVLTPTAGQTININLPGGGQEQYPSSGYTASTSLAGYIGSYSPAVQSQTTLWITTAGAYERHLPDGSKEIYSVANAAGNLFLSQKVDPQGNAVTLTYDSQYRLVAITDAIGQVTTLHYTLAADPLKITQVIDPFGRSASFTYTASAPYQLIKITDEIGITSQMTYGSGDMLATLTTPYGTTNFNLNAVSSQELFLDIIDPSGQAVHYEKRLDGVGIAATEAQAPSGYIAVQNNYLNYRDTYYWDKKTVMDVGYTDYTKAKIYHWDHTPDGGSCSPIVESIKEPLESRVWFNYPGQTPTQSQYEGTSSQPLFVQCILDDGTTQALQYTYNSIGKPLSAIDPLGRTTHYTYAANNIDLLTVTQTNGSIQDLLWSATYNSQHEPLTITDSSAQTTTITYTPQGQLLTVTDPKSNTTTYGYNTSHYLTTVTAPPTATDPAPVTTFGYDSYGRLATVTDSLNYIVSTTFDNLNRPLVTTYPDGTTLQRVYTILDLTFLQDRQNRWIQTFYNNVRQPIQTLNSAGQSTTSTWCACGDLIGITDSNGHATQWTRDIEGRITSQTDAANHTTTYTYGAQSGRLLSTTDPLGQTTTTTYNKDNTPSQIAYSSAVHATHSIATTYDSAYPRPLTITDGIGTTTYTYNAISGTQTTGAGRLASLNGPLPNSTLSYQYDELGRIVGRSLTNSSGSNPNTLSLIYDPLNRVTGQTNSLGSFTFGYVPNTSKLAIVTYPNGQAAHSTYLDNLHDQRLGQLSYSASSGTTLSQFTYSYNPVGTLATWQQQLGSADPSLTTYQYDRADQLLSAKSVDTITQGQLQNLVYGYDLAGNRTSVQNGSGVQQSQYNVLNQISGSGGGGPLQFTGSVNKPSQITIGGIPAAVDSQNNFYGQAQVAVGTNNVPIIALDFSGNSTTNTYQFVVAPGASAPVPTFDLNGNCTADSQGRSYQYDAQNNCIQVVNGATTIQYAYDVQGRRTTETDNGTLVKQWIYDGTTLIEERDGSGTVIKRFFGGLGEQQNGTNYFYCIDHLGSIKAMVDQSGAIVSTIQYDSYGNQTQSTGTLFSTMRYAGGYFDANTSLYRFLHRIYDPSIGRWTQLDPIGLAGGINLYAYVGNDPVNGIDPSGFNNLLPTEVNMGGGGLGIGVQAEEAAAAEILIEEEATSIESAVESSMSRAASRKGSCSPSRGKKKMDPNILSGHGGLQVDDSSPVTIVPEGTSVTVWTEHGNFIDDLIGNSIETRAEITFDTIPNHLVQGHEVSIEGARTYLPGSIIPDYTLYPPNWGFSDPIRIMGNPTTVLVPTNLNELLTPGMGNVNWSACLEIELP